MKCSALKATFSIWRTLHLWRQLYNLYFELWRQVCIEFCSVLQIMYLLLFLTTAVNEEAEVILKWRIVWLWFTPALSWWYHDHHHWLSDVKWSQPSDSDQFSSCRRWWWCGDSVRANRGQPREHRFMFPTRAVCCVWYPRYIWVWENISGK